MGSLILPYNEELLQGDGAFIKPDGEIVWLSLGHEHCARDYCEGDEYNPSKLNKDELKLFKIWVERFDYRRCMYSDFMVYILGWDKIETVMKNCITTTDDKPYTRFYNYYLMDWHIAASNPKMEYNEEKQEFHWSENKDFYTNFCSEREVEEKIKLIKKDVPLGERYLFFK